jgi:alcohol dehydrogenase class IV
MIAIGGGSVIDTAKLISSISPDSSIAKSIIKGETEIQNRNFPLVAIPTTSGSGSECTHFAVAYIDSEKYSVANQSLLPNYIVLDERLTFSMSPYLTAVTGMDAFGQALESFWAVGANKESREYSRAALKIILSIFPDVVHDPTPERRKLMLKASHLAGKAINISKTTGPHAFSYILTMLYGLPHGHAVGLTLAEFFNFNFSDYKHENNIVFDVNNYESIKNDLLKILGCRTIVDAKERIERLLINSGLQNKLTQVGAINISDIEVIKGRINHERLSNNPRSLSQKDIEKIIINIWE